jgi:hypothetical protein
MHQQQQEESHHIGTSVLQSGCEPNETRHAKAEDGQQQQCQDARQTYLHVVDEDHRQTHVVQRRTGGVRAVVVVVAEQPHVANNEPQ